MQVSVEATGGLERRITVQVPAERIEKEIDDRLKSLTRTARVAGFRPGKVPFKVIERKYGAQVRQEVLGEVVQSSFYEAVAQEKLRPAGGPKIEAGKVEPGQNLEYSATFEVYPEIHLASLEGVSIERPVAEVTDEDVERVINTLRKQRVTWNEVDRPGQNEDRLVIDFEGLIEGAPFPGNTGKQVALVLGSGSFIPGFEEQLIGARAGEQRTFDVQFPDDYPAKEVAGKQVRFQVNVSSVSEPQLPEVDESFAKSFGISDGSVQSLRDEVRQNMRRELDQTIRNKVKQQVMDALLEKNKIDLPSALVEQEIDQLIAQAQEQFRDPARRQNLSLPRSLFEEQARRRVALGLIIGEVIKANEIKLDQARVRQMVEGLASTYEHPEEVVNWYYSNRNLLSGIEALVLEEQVVDLLLQQMNVTDTPTEFDSLMNPGRNPQA
ncbi:MAG: trigger factor [Gammaproteobacteria bacterium]